MNIDKIISIVKTLREEAAMVAPTNNVGDGKIAGQCWNCHKTGHKSSACWRPKPKQKFSES